jgi:hypothetical protein
MEPGGSIPHSQGLSNNSYHESNQPNYPHLHMNKNNIQLLNIDVYSYANGKEETISVTSHV